jgi:hypothetical protein
VIKKCCANRRSSRNSSTIEPKGVHESQHNTSAKKYLPHLLKAQDDNLNEADTVQRIVKVFEDVLGYDALSEITREMEITTFCAALSAIQGKLSRHFPSKSQFASSACPSPH